MAGVVLNILALVMTLLVQAACSAALDDLSSGTDVSVVSSAPSQTASSTAEPSANSNTSNGASGASAADSSSANTANANASNAQDLSLGSAVELSNGMRISVDAVEGGFANYNGTPITQVTVTYTNSGSKNLSFNPYEWKAQDLNGVQLNRTYFSDATNDLGSGDLAPGGTITGNLYFEGEVGNLTKIIYQDNMFINEDNASWLVS